MRTHYDNLQVARNASPEVIKGAYKFLSQKWHPDKNQANREEAERNLKIINRAYEVLSDPELRIEHDRWIRSVETEEARFGDAQHRESDDQDQTSSEESTDASGYENRNQPTPDPNDKSAGVEGSSVALTAVIGFGFILSAIYNFWHGSFGNGVLTAAIGAAFLFGSWLIKGQWERENQTRAHHHKAPMFVQMWSDIEAFVKGFRAGLNETVEPAGERATSQRNRANSSQKATSVPSVNADNWHEHLTDSFWGRSAQVLRWTSYFLGWISILAVFLFLNKSPETESQQEYFTQFAVNCALGVLFFIGGPKIVSDWWAQQGRRLDRFSAFLEWATAGIAVGTIFTCAIAGFFTYLLDSYLMNELVVRLILFSVAGSVPWIFVSVLLYLTGAKK